MEATLSYALDGLAAGKGYLVAVFLLSLRLSALFLMTPLLSGFGVPLTVRILFTVGLAAALALGNGSGGFVIVTEGELFVACAREIALGATLALSVIAAFAAVSFAGRLIDVQIGFGMAQVFDPLTRRQVPVLTAAFDKVAVVVFFLVDGHHALLRGVAFSLDRFPLGRPWDLAASAPWVLKQTGAVFTLGVALAAPVVFCLLMVELALGVVSRNLPQMNVLLVSMPAKIVVGLAALSFWFAGMGDAMSRVYGSIYQTWDATFNAAAPARGSR